MERKPDGHEGHSQRCRLLKFHMLRYLPCHNFSDRCVLCEAAIIWSVRGIAFDGTEDSVAYLYSVAAIAANRYDYPRDIASKRGSGGWRKI